ncbi:MAG: diguanylate cyclase domain-containing protein [Vulcanimicrobiaceae bacterium]
MLALRGRRPHDLYEPERGRNRDAAVRLARDGKIVACDPRLERLAGYSDAWLRGRTCLDVVAPVAHARAERLLARVMSGEPVAWHLPMVLANGTHAPAHGTAAPFVRGGRLRGALVFVEPEPPSRRSAYREARARVRELHLVAAPTAESPDAQIDAAIALGRRRLDCAGGYLARAGDPRRRLADARARGDDEVQRIPADDRLHRAVLAADETFALADLARTPWAPREGGLASAGPFVGTPIVVGGVRVGALCFYRHREDQRPFTRADRDFVRTLGAIVASVLERQQQRRRLDALAFFDALTGLPNRVLLEDRLGRLIASAGRHAGRFAVHFYDLDGFKAINDSFGHSRGDEVLRALARRFESVVRREDTVARLGGDEFVILQPGLGNAADAAVLAERIRAAIAAPIEIGTSQHRLSASAGIALFPDDAREGSTLIARADAALYRVKRAGRDGIAFASGHKL